SSGGDSESPAGCASLGGSFDVSCAYEGVWVSTTTTSAHRIFTARWPLCRRLEPLIACHASISLMRLNYVSAKTQDIRRRAIPCLVVLVAWGCATTKPRHVWTEDALAAETLQAHGELDEALARYEQLLPDAP